MILPFSPLVSGTRRDEQELDLWLILQISKWIHVPPRKKPIYQLAFWALTSEEPSLERIGVKDP
jgi:hypothetical protein